MSIYRGTYYSKAIQFKNKSDGTPIDITTWQFAASLRSDDGTDLLDMSTSGGHFTVFDGPNGWMRFALTPTQNQNLPDGVVMAALYRTDDPNGDIRLGLMQDIVTDKD